MNPAQTLADVLTLAEVKSLADATTFARGKAYYQEGAVSRLVQDDGAVYASVQGTYRYSIELGVGDDGGLTYECDCPVGEDGIFSKHAVAVALSWLENTGEEIFHFDEATQEAQDLWGANPRVRRNAESRLLGVTSMGDRKHARALIFP
jgi:uncharacterized Zn finger protein